MKSRLLMIDVFNIKRDFHISKNVRADVIWQKMLDNPETTRP